MQYSSYDSLQTELQLFRLNPWHYKNLNVAPIITLRLSVKTVASLAKLKTAFTTSSDISEKNQTWITF